VSDTRAILASRLFGYAVLFRARPADGGGFDPVETAAADEARALKRELQLFAGQPVDEGESDAGEVGISVPFGRCGIDGRPEEHVRVLHAQEAWVDRLTPGGLQTESVAEGETVRVTPGSFVRFRGVPRPGGRVLVAFHTEDRSPLSGHAAPLSRAGEEIPADAAGRLRVTTAAFEALGADPSAAADRLAEIFDEMRGTVDSSADVTAAQSVARGAGSYEASGAEDLFAASRDLLSAEVIDRIGAGDPALFRFPGMFGAVAPLFPLLEE
jgi:hypothetical protein